MYRETLQKKKERLEALRSRRREAAGQMPSTLVRDFDVDSGEEPQRKISGDLNAWIHNVMDSVKKEDKHGAVLKEEEPMRPSEEPTARSLARSQLREISFPPQERILYNKASQTLDQIFVSEVEEAEAPVTVVSSADPQKKEEEEEEEREEEQQAHNLTEAEKAVVVESESFLSFIHRTSRITERLLAHTSASDDVIKKEEPRQETALGLERTFFEERRCRHRVVTGLHWSPTFPELLAASYSASDVGLTDPDGLCLVWNTKYRKDSPEMVFQSPSPTLSVSFVEFAPHLLVAGTYSGQVMLWDSRNWRATPVMKSPLSTQAHTAPVHCLRSMGPHGAQKLVSLSSDGALCWWSLTQLNAPLDRCQMRHSRTECMTATCFDFFHQDVRSFAFGSEEGPVFLSSARPPLRGVREVFRHHMAPVTGISSHCSEGPVDFYHLFLTSAMDWSVTLWSRRDRCPLRTFPDPLGYVYDVKWSPKHPAMFAAVNDSGILDVWDLNRDSEASIARLHIRGEEPTALNKLSWRASGTEIAAGDAHGRVHICSLNADVALPCANEWSDMQQSLNSICATTAHGYLEDSSLFTEPEEDLPRTPSRSIREFFSM